MDQYLPVKGKENTREAHSATRGTAQPFITGGIMASENGNPARNDYAGTGETHTENTDPDDAGRARPGREQPDMLVELVIVEGPEGKKLHAIQAEVIRRILTRLAERHIHTLQKESRL